MYLLGNRFVRRHPICGWYGSHIPPFCFLGVGEATNQDTTEVCLDCLSLLETKAIAFSVTRFSLRCRKSVVCRQNLWCIK